MMGTRVADLMRACFEMDPNLWLLQSLHGESEGHANAFESDQLWNDAKQEPTPFSKLSVMFAL